ncbi:MAG: branched-chain-amino-acid transaminase [Kiritimatiellia bacterium]
MMIYLNGRLVPDTEAVVSVFDHGLLYGDGVFEGIRSYNGRVFLLRDHVARLYRSAQAIGLNIPMSQEEMCRAVIATCLANNCRNGYIRLVVTRGVGNLGLNPYQCPKPGVIIIAATIQLYPPELYEKGLRIITVGTVRNHPEALNPNIKSLNYLNNILAKIEAINSGVQEAVMLNHLGYVCEATGDNIFVVSGRNLITPPAWCGCLVGITRNTVMQLAAANGLQVRESVMTRYDLYNADEVFLTGTAAELIPVVEIDKRTIGRGAPGPLTQKLTQLFRAFAAQPESGEEIA